MMKSSALDKMIRIFARLGTGLLVMGLFWSCVKVPGLVEEAPGSFIRVPFVRVLLEENNNSVTIDADGSFAIECLVDGTQTVYYSSRPVTVKNEHGSIIVLGRGGAVIHENLDEVNLIPRGNGNHIRVDNVRFRGMLKVLTDGQNLKQINIVYMEDYLKGVVPPEIGRRAENEIEAVMAQAVAARTYAMAHLKQYRGQPYDMKSSIIDQVYEGLGVENALINRAIEKTAGQILMYEDEFVNAYYHSTCGGMTDDVADVWDRKEIPYLTAVADSGACSWSKYYNWKETFTEKQLRGRIEQYLSSDRGRDLKIGTITDVVIGQHTPGGRVLKLMVRTDHDIYKFKKDRIRWVIGRTSNPDLILPSDRFDVSLGRDKSGNLLRVVFSGQGYGHGVGMCQCGAIGLARVGWAFEQILTHYYAGVEIKKLY